MDSILRPCRNPLQPRILGGTSGTRNGLLDGILMSGVEGTSGTRNGLAGSTHSQARYHAWGWGVNLGQERLWWSCTLDAGLPSPIALCK